MAVNDSTAPKGIPTTGQLSPGLNEANRSINLLKNIKTATARAQANTSVNELRNWFRTYVGFAGNFDNNKANNEQVNLSDFRGAEILGVDVKVKNETNSTYATNKDFKVIIKGLFSQKYKYSVGVEQGSRSLNNTILHGNTATFTGFDGARPGSTTNPSVSPKAAGDITVKITPFFANGKESMRQHSFKIKPAYSGTAQVLGTNTNGVDGSMGVSTQTINFTYSGGAGKGKTSNSLYLLTGKQDPSGRTYGPSMSYP